MPWRKLLTGKISFENAFFILVGIIIGFVMTTVLLTSGSHIQKGTTKIDRKPAGSSIWTSNNNGAACAQVYFSQPRNAWIAEQFSQYNPRKLFLTQELAEKYVMTKWCQ